MPRPKHVRRNLSDGWRNLHHLWKLSLEEKILESHSLIRSSLRKCKRPVICWSGGKDSTVILHLILQHLPNIPVIYVSTGVEFEESNIFVNQARHEWNLNLHIARPSEDLSFWIIGEKFGWPIFGKSIAHNVELARRTGNVRKQLSAFEKRIVEANLNISTKCAKLLLERPSMRFEENLGADSKFVGLRAEESRSRVRLWVDHGDSYFVKRYYGRGRGIWKINPIAIWTENDILEYHKKHKINFCSLYKMGYPRNGCWPCAMAIRNGQLERLRKYHPHLFHRLLTKTKMGLELYKRPLINRLIEAHFRSSSFVFKG